MKTDWTSDWVINEVVICDHDCRFIHSPELPVQMGSRLKKFQNPFALAARSDFKIIITVGFIK